MQSRRFRHYLIERASLAVLIVCVLLSHSFAGAAPVPELVVPIAASLVESAQPASQLEPVASVDPVLGASVDSATLDAQRGGTDTVNNNMQLHGGVTDNIANHVVTGANSIDAGSFANMSGIPTVIQNSGANVLIQNAMIINLQFQ
ncbi:MAG: hypothetical protein M3Y65_01970 [Pseudomonadota bacterium]|nr:hypothetical protein [Pseudomonadota bacterium]